MAHFLPFNCVIINEGILSSSQSCSTVWLLDIIVNDRGTRFIASVLKPYIASLHIPSLSFLVVSADQEESKVQGSKEIYT